MKTAKSKIEHTPTPLACEEDANGTGYWLKVDALTVGVAYTEPFAKQIVRAVNSHNELLEALKSLHINWVSCEKGRLICPYKQIIAKAEAS